MRQCIQTGPKWGVELLGMVLVNTGGPVEHAEIENLKKYPAMGTRT